MSNGTYKLSLLINTTTIADNKAGLGFEPNPGEGINGLDGVGGGLYSNTSQAFNLSFCRIIDDTPQAIYLNLANVNIGGILFKNNWWGTNSEPVDQVTGKNIDCFYYTPWLILSITANPTSITNTQNSNVTANLIMNSNGENTLTKYGISVPNGIPVEFGTNLGTVNPQNGVTVNGVCTTNLAVNTDSGTAKVSATVDKQTVSTNVVITPTLTINQLTTAASIVKTYYELHHVLPTNVLVGSTIVNMSQFLNLLVTATLNISNGNLNPIKYLAVNPAPSSSGGYTSGNLVKSSYLTVALNIKNFISANGRAPNYVTTSLGKIPFNKLVYMYAKIIDFYRVNNRLPNYVSI